MHNNIGLNIGGGRIFITRENTLLATVSVV